MTLPNYFALVGPTASGKTEFSLELLKAFPLEVINADSLQIYKHLNIGTSKPQADLLEAYPHHMFDVLSPDEPATAGWYAKTAMRVAQDILSRKKHVLLVGGSGFYLRAFEHPPLETPATPFAEISASQIEKAKQKNPQAFEQLHPNDTYRNMRTAFLVLEGYDPKFVSQTTLSEPLHFIGILWPRKELYARINARVESMLQNGLIQETQTVLETFPKARTKLEKTIGYKEVLLHLEGKLSFGEMKSLIAQKTRNYAKRQMTWFRQNKRIRWFEFSQVEQCKTWIKSL